MNGGRSIWAISPEERDKHDQKFDTLSPVHGIVTGEKARGFFLQSGLPSSVLAEIWALADMNKDGKMDRLEFSIAMKLIKMKLQGQNLPSALPIIMKQPPVPAPTMPLAPLGMGSMQNIPMVPTMPVLTPMLPSVSPMPGMTAMMSTGQTMPIMAAISAPSLANGPVVMLQPNPVSLTNALPLNSYYTSSPLGFPSTPKPSALLDLGSSSSSSSSIASLASSSPQTGPLDWAVPQASRLKYRQQFNSLDRQMVGYLSGPQVRSAMASTSLSQTQLATIWNLADVDKDGKLKADEFVLAMHLVDMAKEGQVLPLALPVDLVPPSLRGNVGDAMNGSTSSSIYASVAEEFVEADLPQKSKNILTFEDKFKENLERGNAELEKRRLALLEQQRREEERRAQKVREEQERKEREAREQELRRKREEEQRLERQKELERQREEERLKELERKEAARKELERQRQLELEKKKKQDLQNHKNHEQEIIIHLKSKKRSLELELEAVGNKHKEISEKLRDAQAKKKVQKIELDHINQKRDGQIIEINSLQQQFEEFQRNLAQLAPEQQRLNGMLRNVNLKSNPASSVTTLQKDVTEKDLSCRKLKEQLDALENEMAAKLGDMEQYKKEIQDLRESQRDKQSALDKLYRLKEDKFRELKRCKEEALEKKRKEEEEQRRIKQEKDRQWQEKLRRDEEERQRKLMEERAAKLREEEERERQARMQAVKEQAERELRAREEEERRRREKEEEERRRREEEERRQREEHESKRREEDERREQERRRREEEDHKRREEERRKLEEERRKLEEERRKLEEERRRQEEERREEEKRRQEEERKREERRRAEEDRREEERRKEREEEERRRQRAQEAAIRDTEERKKKEEERKRKEEERKRQEEEDRRRRAEEDRSRREEEDRRRRDEEDRRRRDEERKKQDEERRRKRQDVQTSAVARPKDEKQNNSKPDIVAALLRGLEERKGIKQPLGKSHRKSAALTRFTALYPFSARNEEELSFETGDIIEVDETTEREQGWLYGSFQGKMGWFPESYVEKHHKQETPSTKGALKPQPFLSTSRSSNVTEASVQSGSGQNSAFTRTQAMGSTSTEHRQVAGKVQAKALVSWTAKTDNHLNFSKDDVILVLEQQENWWLGELNGTQGWFPKNYVTVLTSSDLSADSTEGLESSAADASSLEEYLALYTYESPEPTDLTFTEGDTILVSQREEEWWRGSIGDRSGLFPSNYVKPKEADNSVLKSGALGKKPEVAQVTSVYTASGTGQLNLSPGQLIVVLGKNHSGWWLGELQARGKKRQKGWFPSSHVKQLGSNSGKSTPAIAAAGQVIALYDYTAANQDELSFSKSQIINLLDKSNPDWWRGEISGVTGLVPSNYVKMTTSESDPSQQWCADLTSLDSMSLQEKKRQGYIHELIETEEKYMEDLQLVLEVFHKPMSESGRLTEAEMNMIFVNWKELIMSNTKMVKALRARKKMGGEKMPVQMIGDILATELSHMQAYIRFCSCQLNAAALLQQRTDQEPEFKDFLKKIATDYRCKGMPLSSFLLKPMQRITRYPLHIKNILESTPENHVDHAHLREALEKAEELCSQVNEGVREKENSDRLEWIQNHVQCDGITENLDFNSLTNCLGPRRLLHSGKMFKTKSNKELYAFLFNDFLLLTQAVKQFTSSGSDRLFSPKSNTQYKMYKSPLFLNEVLVKMPSDPSSDEPIFHISHIDRVYTLKTDNINERTAWVQKIKAASEEFIEMEKSKREKAYQGRSMKATGIGRLLVTVQEATELKSSKPSGKCNSYCEVTMGAQCYTSRTLNDTLNPKWNFNCQFHIRDLYQDVLCITIYEREQFVPDEFLGRTELPVATIKKDLENKGAITKRLLLHEVPTGEVWVRLDFQLFDGKTPK